MRLLICSFALILTACSPGMRVKPGEIPPPVPPSAQAQKDAKAYVEGFVQQYKYQKVSSKSPEHKEVVRVATRLLKAAGYNPSLFPITVVDAGDEVNAMVLEGSSIIVFKHLLDQTTEPELAVVLAHEVGHLLGNHAALHDEEQSRAENVSLFGSILGSAASIATSAAGYGGLSDVAGGVTEGVTDVVGYGAYVGSFSRDQEYEADHIGLMLMAKAGYDPHTAVAFWNRSEEVFGSRNSTVGAFFSTHPAEGNRAEALQKYMPLAMQYYSPKGSKS